MSAARNQRALLPATVRENENPVALLHVPDETAFLDLSVGAAQDPPAVALAIHVGPFFDPSIRKADHPVAVTFPIPERPAGLGLLCRQVRLHPIRMPTHQENCPQRGGGARSRDPHRNDPNGRVAAVAGGQDRPLWLVPSAWR